MADRPMVLARLHKDYEQTLAALLNVWRLTNKVPGEFSTSVGRGSNGKQLGVNTITSFALAAALDDPKNIVKLLPAVGAMVPTFAERVLRERGQENRLLGVTRHFTTTMRIRSLVAGDTLFRFMSEMAELTALEWRGEFHLSMLDGFKLTIQVSPQLSATMEMPADEGWITVHTFAPPASKRRKAQPKATIPSRSVSITFAQIEMVADLYRDTLTRNAAVEASELQAILALNDDDTTPTPENENAALPGAAPSRNQKPLRRGSDLHSQEYAGERDTTQSPRRGRSGPSHPNVRTARHADRRPHSAFPSCA